MLSIQKTEVQKERDRLENPPEKVEVLQEELELEKEKKEIISSMYDDWIYEYDVKEKKLTTISGSSSCYRSAEKQQDGQKFLSLDDLHPEDRTRFVECCRGVYGDRQAGYMEARVMVEGDYHWISLTTKVLRNRAGEIVSVIGKISDINARKKEELRLMAQAMQDSMTGLLNRTAFQEQSQKLLELALQTEGRTPAMLIVDIDKFGSDNNSI
jgi:PAS domain-containing protein